MGPMLSKPVLSSIYERAGSSLFKIGSACVNGHRESMEDAHVVHQADGWGLFGVFDGHVNDLCSQYLEEEWAKFARSLTFAQLPLSDEMIKQTCLRIDKQYLDAKRTGGSTGTFFIAHKTGPNSIHLTVGNVGDSRVLVGQKGTCLAMTTDHKPNDPEERRRIIACKGHVENNRVNGSLALSRAFGDGDYKRNGDDQLQQQVIALPDVTHIDLSLDGSDYAVVACDGVFEGNFSNEQVIQFVNEQLATGEKDLAYIANKVCVEAIVRGSKDNISCMIVQFGDGTGFGSGAATSPSSPVAAATSSSPVTNVNSLPGKDFIPGPFSLPGNSQFRRAYFEMARKAGYTPAQALEKRWAQMEAKKADAAGSAATQIIPAIDDQEAQLFKGGPEKSLTGEQRTEWFAGLVSAAEEQDDARGGGAGGAGGLPGPLARALALQHQLGIPLHMLLDMMSGHEPGDGDE
jgi:protein phosphatase